MVFFHSTPVDVFDSNIWILGITERHSGASGLIQSALDGDRSVVVSPYIYDEVFAAFDRDLDSSHAIDAAKDNFSNIVFNNPNIDGPTQTQLERMNLEQVRNCSGMQMMGQVLGIQPKDVPIVVAAWEYRSDNPTIFTADTSFSKFVPSQHRLPGIDMVHIEV